MEEVKTKICPKCGEGKPLTTEFFFWRKDRNVWSTPCKRCQIKRKMEKYHSDPSFRRRCIDDTNNRHKSKIVREIMLTCPQCGETKRLKRFGGQARKFCSKECNSKWHHDRRDKTKENESQRDYKVRRPEQYQKRLEKNAALRRKASEGLKDWYVNFILTRQLKERAGIEFDITPELTKLKRKQLKIHRFVKKTKEVLHGSHRK